MNTLFLLCTNTLFWYQVEIQIACRNENNLREKIVNRNSWKLETIRPGREGQWITARENLQNVMHSQNCNYLKFCVPMTSERRKPLRPQPAVRNRHVEKATRSCRCTINLPQFFRLRIKARLMKVGAENMWIENETIIQIQNWPAFIPELMWGSCAQSLVHQIPKV